MERQSLEAALIFFNQMSVWMYMPSVLPDVVFIDPQMPLDSINRIVQYSFRVGEGAIPGLAPSECRLWKEGVVTSEMLKGEEFHGCFVKGLFEVDDALKLFQEALHCSSSERDGVHNACHAPDGGREGYESVLACSAVSMLPLSFSTSTCPALLKVCSAPPIPACAPSMGGPHRTLIVKGTRKFQLCLFRNAVQLATSERSHYKVTLHSCRHSTLLYHLDCTTVRPAQCMS